MGDLCRDAICRPRDPACIKVEPRSGLTKRTVALYRKTLQECAEEPVDDAALSRCLQTLLQRRAGMHKAKILLTAARWRAGENRAMSPYGPLSKQAMRDFRKTHSEGQLASKDRSAQVSKGTAEVYASALRRMGLPHGALPTDAQLAAFCRRMQQRGRGLATAHMHISAVAWLARSTNRPNPRGPLTNAVLKDIRAQEEAQP